MQEIQKEVAKKHKIAGLSSLTVSIFSFNQLVPLALK